MPDAIVLRDLTKTFGERVAVRDLDLVVPRGAFYGLIGPNGAGKTTAIRLMLSILLPDRGTVSVLGRGSALEAKDRIGYLPEERGLYRRMRVGQFLAYMARLKQARDAAADGHIRTWLDRAGLGDVEQRRCEELSKGMQQKVQYLAAVIHRPDLLILDEPFSGLDPVGQRLLRDLVLEEHRRGATILFSTHVMFHAEQLCDRVVMLHRGRKVLDTGLAALRMHHDPRSLLFEPLHPEADMRVLAELPGVDQVRREGASWSLQVGPSADPSEVIRRIVAAVPPARIEVRRRTLEDVFVDIVAGPAGGDDAAALRAAVRDEGETPEAVRP